jgi:hypothetical protein
MSWLGITQHDEADGVILQLPVPGYRRRDLSIDVRERLVTVRGERADGWLKQPSRKSFAQPPQHCAQVGPFRNSGDTLPAQGIRR